MLQTKVMRTPMPGASELQSLPPIAKDMLSFFESNMNMDSRDDVIEYKALARTVVDTVNGVVPSDLALRYRNPSLREAAKNFADLGEYNPDRIPVHIYEKMRLHPQVALATSFIELQILAQSYRIECADRKKAIFVQEALRKLYRKTVKSLLRAIQYGFTVGEKIYDQRKFKVVKEDEKGNKSTIYDGTAVLIDRIKFVYPGSVKIVRDEDSEQIAFVTQTADYTQGHTEPPMVPIEKCVWFALDDEYGNFFGTARYKAAYQPWYWAQIIMQFALRYLERRGSPAVKGRAPFGKSVNSDGDKVNNIDVILNAANAVVSNSAIAIPSQYKDGKQLWDVELLEDEQRGELFLDMLRYLNILITRALFVPDKVGVAEGSSTNATAESHFDVHLLSNESLIQFIEDAFNFQIIPDLMKFNFPPSKQVPCYLKIERLNYSKRTLLRDVLVRMIMLYSGSMKDGNWPTWLPSVKEISEFLEIPGSEVEDLFLPVLNNDGNNGGTDSDDDDDNSDGDGKDSDTGLEKQQKVKQRNKDNQRRTIPRRDRRSRERK